MIMITVALNVLIFGFCLGAILCVLIFVPTAIYVIPYFFWVAGQNSIGKHKDKKNEKVSRSVRNATRLYAAWITRREPTF